MHTGGGMLGVCYQRWGLWFGFSRAKKSKGGSEPPLDVEPWWLV